MLSNQVIVALTCRQGICIDHVITYHINFRSVQSVAVVSISPQGPQSLFINCQVHRSVTTPLVVIFSWCKTTHGDKCFLFIGLYIVLDNVS